MKQKIHKFCDIVFSITLLVYILIWCTVSYIGVYVTYVAMPVLIISGVIGYLTMEDD